MYSVVGSTMRESDILADLDTTSMFDHDLFSPPFSPKLQPLNAEDLMHSLPPMSPEPFSNSCGNSSTWGHKSELLNDDLDHIMQILVGMWPGEDWGSNQQGNSATKH